MPRPSTIKRLPPEVLAEVNRILAGEEMTLDQLVEHLRALGHPRSRSALGRHKKNLDEVAEKLRRSRATAEALVKEIGPSAVEGKTGRLLAEILQSIVFEHLLDRADGAEEGTTPMELARLAKALKDLASAQKIDTDRELAIREETAHKAAERAVAIAKKVAAEGGVTLGREALRRIREEVGIAAA